MASPPSAPLYFVKRIHDAISIIGRCNNGHKHVFLRVIQVHFLNYLHEQGGFKKIKKNPHIFTSGRTFNDRKWHLTST